MFPSQQRMLRQVCKKAAKFDHFRKRTRRSFVIGGVAGVVAAAGAFWMGLRCAQPAAATPLPTLATTDTFTRLAIGPIEDLQRAARLYLDACETRPDGDILWYGYHRLVAVAAKDNTDTPLRRMILRVASRSDAPPSAKDAATLLQGR
jgi:hypothetical protein